jgi:hypothetical protein
MRDRRYVLSRRRYGVLQRTDVAGFKALDEAARNEYKPRPFWRWWMIPAFVLYVAFLVGVNLYADRDAEHREPPEPEPTKYQIARDEAAKERAAAFLRGLGFEPGPAVCRAKRDGSAWCTIRVASSEKTFALWCSDEHPNCIERRGDE